VENLINIIFSFFSLLQTYAHSKLANIVFTKEVAKRWASDGIKSYSVHPGYVRTNIFNGASDLMKRLYPVTTILVSIQPILLDLFSEKLDRLKKITCIKWSSV